MKIKIEFLSWTGKAALEIEAGSLNEAVEKAVKDGANLDGAYLSGADLSGAYLSGADLRCAYLSGADLRCADLSGANLRCADWSGANLRCADLSGADLRCADLRCADLSGADLSGANLGDAYLGGAKYGDRKLWETRPVLLLGPCVRSGRMTVVFFFSDGGDPLIRCGCFTGTIAAFRAKIYDTHAGTFHESEYNAMANYIDEMYAIQQEELKAQNGAL